MEAGLLPVEALPLGVRPDPEPLRVLPASALTDLEIPDTLAELPCVEPLGVEKPAAVALESAVPKMLAELPDAVTKVDAILVSVREELPDKTFVRETKLVCDAAADAVV